MKHGVTNPKIKTLIKIANVFNVSIDSMINTNNEKQTQDTTLLYVNNYEEEVLKELRTLTPEIKIYVKDLIYLASKKTTRTGANV